METLPLKLSLGEQSFFELGGGLAVIGQQSLQTAAF